MALYEIDGVAPQLGLVTTTWTDYLATVFAFVKPDGDPVSPDGAMASGSIQVTFRDWVHHWIVDDFFADIGDLVGVYRGRIPGLIHTPTRKESNLWEKKILRENQLPYPILEGIDITEYFPKFSNDSPV